MALTNVQILDVQMEMVRKGIMEHMLRPMPDLLKYNRRRDFSETYCKPEPKQLELAGIEHPPEPYKECDCYGE